MLALYRRIGVTAYQIEPDLDSVVETIARTIQNGICLVGENACAGGFIVPFLFNYHERIGYVAFWNYSGPSGIRIFPALLEALRDAGATQINVASHFPHNTIARYYARFGLRQTEIQHSCAVADMNIPPFTLKGAQ